MKTGWLRVALVAPLFLATAAAQGSDSDLSEETQKRLAHKFCPSLVLHSGDQGVAPEPVEIMGPIWLWTVRLVDSPPVYTGEVFTLNKDHDYSWMDSWDWEGPFGTQTTCDYVPVFNFLWHFDYAESGPTPHCPNIVSTAHYDQPEGWYEAYLDDDPENDYAGSKYPHTIYAHVFSYGLKYVVQYYFFYPFNDGFNNHEGDWEHINVIISTGDPDTAVLERVVYYFHHSYYVAVDTQAESPSQFDCYVVDGSHPVVFVGGHTEIDNTWGHGSGEGTHGSFPHPGWWYHIGTRDVSCGPFEKHVDGVDEQVDGQGQYIHWSEIVANQCVDDDYGVVLLDCADCYDYDGADIKMGWLRADIMWGHPWVRSYASGLESPGLTIAECFLSDDPIGNMPPHGPVYGGGWNRPLDPVDAQPFGGRQFARASESGWEPPTVNPNLPNVGPFISSPSAGSLVSGFVDVAGMTCRGDSAIGVDWGHGSEPTTWSTHGMDIDAGVGPIPEMVYCTWNTGVVPAGTYTMRCRAYSYGGLVEEERVTINVQHQSYVVSQDPPGQFTSIQDAINSAQVGDTVYVASGQVIVENIRMEDCVNLIGQNGDATIVGQGNAPTIDLTRASNVFGCLVEGLTLTRSSAGGSDAHAIFSRTNGAVIRNCTIINHSANEGAAALILDGSRIRFESCVFASNESDQPPIPSRGASAVAARGSTAGSWPYILYKLPDVEFLDCVFTDNYAMSASAGVVAIEYPDFTPEVIKQRPRFERCHFLGNRNTGGISCITVSNCDRLELIECEFTDNDAGAVIDIHDSGLYMVKCTVAANGHNNGVLEGGTFAVQLDNPTSLEVRESIIAFHGSPAFFCGSYMPTSGVENNIFFGNTGGVSSQGWCGMSDAAWAASGHGNLNINPAFCQPVVDTDARGDYQLFAYSPAAAPAPPSAGYFGVRVGALDVGCVPSADITASASQVIPEKPWIVVACPQGDQCPNTYASDLVVTVDLNGTITRNIDTLELALDAADCVATTRVFDQSGFVVADADAAGPNYATTITHSYFGGYGVNDVDVLLNGYVVGSKAHFDLRTADLAPDGVVNLGDFAHFGQYFPPAPNKPYSSHVDYNANDTVDLGDYSIFGSHFSHEVPSGYTQLNPSNEPETSNAGVTLAFAEEFPTANTHRLYVDVNVENFSSVTMSVFSIRTGSNRLTFVDWVPGANPIGDVLFTPADRNGEQEMFYGLFVSESFTGSGALLGRLVFDVAGAEPVDITENNFVLTAGEVSLEAPEGNFVVASMQGVMERRLDPASNIVYHDRLEQNFPNPFNPSTTLAFSLKTGRDVRLTIYDVAGRRVRELVNERRDRGVYKVTWNGQNDTGQTVASGVYFYKLVAGSFTDTKKMTILK